jgi:DDE superfamily endonuclease
MGQRHKRQHRLPHLLVGPHGPGPPAELDLHVIVDNLSAHSAEKAAILFAHNPRVHLHFTPTNASWLNQVELFFSILERRLLRRGEFPSVDDLARRFMGFINDYNRRAAPFPYDNRTLMAA